MGKKNGGRGDNRPPYLTHRQVTSRLLNFEEKLSAIAAPTLKLILLHFFQYFWQIEILIGEIMQS